MNRRNQTIVSDEALVAYLKRNYTYDAERGKLVRRETGRVVKGSNKGRYMSCDIWNGYKVMHLFYHRAIWAVVHGYLPIVIDHINGNPLDNRLENLREISQGDNRLNSVYPWRPNARTGLPGVSDANGCFQISYSGKSFYFRDKHEAFFRLILLGRMFRPN